MHGVRRTRLSAQAAESKKLKEKEKIAKYTALERDVLDRRRRQEYTREALQATTDLLDQNPEYYTIWNYRRNILTNGLFPSMSDDEKVKLLGNDIRLTTAYLHVNPKVYWIWNHRKWCLESVPLGPESSEGWKNDFWTVEMGLIEALLQSDPRNFHAWGYRRYVIASLPESFPGRKTPQDELRFTKKKIESNFSNFSAWHYRTKLLEGLWKDSPVDVVKAEKAQEFDFVRQALWTDPGDQSAWLYHRWLIGNDPDADVLKAEVASIRELHEIEPDSKWCMKALAHCDSLLSNSSTDSEEVKKLQGDAANLMERLSQVDGDRTTRYKEWISDMT